MTSDLLSRLSSATGPSRELDAEIALANGWKLNANIEDLWLRPDGHLQSGSPRYTESIDAVRPLLHGFTWDVGTYGDRYRATVRTSVTIAATPAIALLIAIEKAKEELKP